MKVRLEQLKQRALNRDFMMVQYLNTIKNKILKFTNKLFLFTTIFIFGGYCFLILSREHFVTISHELFGETIYIMNSIFLDIALSKPLILLPIMASIVVISNHSKNQTLYKQLHYNLVSALLSTLIVSVILYLIYVR